MTSSKERLLQCLEMGETVHRFDAWERLGMVNLPARILELRREGWPIRTESREVVSPHGNKVRLTHYFMNRTHVVQTATTESLMVRLKEVA